MPEVIIIAGPNGAGKTLLSLEFLKKDFHEYNYINVDNIAFDLNPQKPEKANISAGRKTWEELRALRENAKDFIFETTLSGRSLAEFLKSCTVKRYIITLVFLWLPSADMAVKRVQNRVKQGGHSVPEKDVRRRFHRGLRNLLRIYLPLCDRGIILDSTKPVGKQPRIVEKTRNKNLIIHNEKIWQSLSKEVGDGR
jgi:predicted ABC-type ATPase